MPAQDLGDARGARIEDDAAIGGVEDHHARLRQSVRQRDERGPRDRFEVILDQVAQVTMTPDDAAFHRIDASQRARCFDQQVSKRPDPLPDDGGIELQIPRRRDLRDVLEPGLRDQSRRGREGEEGECHREEQGSGNRQAHRVTPSSS